VDITPSQLRGQYQRAVEEWPFVHGIEAEFGLPPFLLFAIGSKETNLRNIEGDFDQRAGEDSPRNHGFGVIQRDLQHGIPDGWMDDVEGQFRWAAELLVSKIERTGSLAGGVVAYNGSGSRAEAYGVDVLERREFLAATFPVPVTKRPQEVTMLIISFNGHCYLLSGGVRTQIDRPEQIDQLKAAGVPEVQGDHRWAAAFPVGAPA
jgi:hypothetical protein